jgi:hypothetical protein
MKQIFSTTDVAKAAEFERSLPPGDYEVQVQLLEPMAITLDQLRDYLASMGIELYSVNLKGNILDIRYHKAEAEAIGQWQLIITLIVPLVVTGAVIFGIFKLGDITSAIIPILLVAGGLVVVIIAAAGREAVTAGAVAAAKRF